MLSDVLGRAVSLLDSLLVGAVQQRRPACGSWSTRPRSTSRTSRTASCRTGSSARAGRRRGASSLIGQLFGQAQDVVTIVELRRRPRRLRAVAHRAARARARARRSSARRTSTRRATRSTTRRTPERRELDYVRQTGASVETAKEVKIFGLNALPDRALPRAGRRASIDANRRLAMRRAGWGGLLTAIGTRRLLRRLRLHRLAHAARRLHHRRPHLPRRLVPAPAQPARGPADRLLAGRRPGALPRRPVLLLRDPAGDRLAAEPAAVPGPDPRGLRLRGRRLPLSRAPSAGRCAT